MKSPSLQNLGFAIAALSIIALIVSFNENKFTLDELITMEGKVTKVQLVKGGKYMNKIVSITCQLDSDRYFSVPIKSGFGTPEEVGDKIKNANKVKLWLVKDYASWEILDRKQLVVDNFLYIDFNEQHAELPENFWLFCIALVIGILFIFLERIMTRVVKNKNFR